MMCHIPPMRSGLAILLIIIAFCNQCTKCQHWWNWEDVLQPQVSPAFTPMPGKRFTHEPLIGGYPSKPNDVIINIPRAGLGTFIGFSQRVDYDYTWSQWPPEKGRLVNVFLGIPYAAPPIDDNRFTYPRPAYLDTRYDYYANEYKPACLQSSADSILFKKFQNFSHMSEDCLYLNVFTPNRTWEPPTLLYPVIVHIHGGDFVSGSAHLYPGHALASMGMVVVTFNYRLGPMGFLSTGDFASLGNYGLWDQLEAMSWVRDNIWWFRGDPNQITLMGDSAGGASVGLHLISPASINRDLYQQAIMMSGSDMSPWAVSIPAQVRMKEYVVKLGEYLNCPTQDSFSLVYCLRYYSDPNQLVQIALNKSLIPVLPGAPRPIWTPVVDGSVGFLPRDPREERKQGRFAHVPFLAGVVHDEGADHAEEFLQKHFQRSLTDEFDDALLRKCVYRFLESMRAYRLNETSEELYMRYVWWSNTANETARREQFISMFSDYDTNSAVDATLRYQAPHTGNAYFYEFAYRSPNDTKPKEFGIYNGVDVQFLWGYPFMNASFWSTLYPRHVFQPSLSPWFYPHDHNISEFALLLWSNFVRYGNPTPYEFRNITWLNYTVEIQPYLHLYINGSIRYGFRQSHSAFWRERFQLIAEPLSPSDPIYYYPLMMSQISTYALSVLIILMMCVCVVLIVCLCQRHDPDDFSQRAVTGPSQFSAAFSDKFPIGGGGGGGTGGTSSSGPLLMSDTSSIISPEPMRPSTSFASYKYKSLAGTSESQM